MKTIVLLATSVLSVSLFAQNVKKTQWQKAVSTILMEWEAKRLS